MGAMVAVGLIFIPLANNNKVADQIVPVDSLNSQSRKAMGANPSPVKYKEGICHMLASRSKAVCEDQPCTPDVRSNQGADVNTYYISSNRSGPSSAHGEVNINS